MASRRPPRMPPQPMPKASPKPARLKFAQLLEKQAEIDNGAAVAGSTSASIPGEQRLPHARAVDDMPRFTASAEVPPWNSGTRTARPSEAEEDETVGSATRFIRRRPLTSYGIAVGVPWACWYSYQRYFRADDQTFGGDDVGRMSGLKSGWATDKTLEL